MRNVFLSLRSFKKRVNSRFFLDVCCVGPWVAHFNWNKFSHSGISHHWNLRRLFLSQIYWWINTENSTRCFIPEEGCSDKRRRVREWDTGMRSVHCYRVSLIAGKQATWCLHAVAWMHDDRAAAIHTLYVCPFAELPRGAKTFIGLPTSVLMNYKLLRLTVLHSLL